jgi:hypothetical protein
MRVPYSEVITRAPITTMISSPKLAVPPRLIAVGSKDAWAALDLLAAASPMAAASPPTKNVASVIQVDRTERILVNSESSVPGNPDLRLAGGTALTR